MTSSSDESNQCAAGEKAQTKATKSAQRDINRARVAMEVSRITLERRSLGGRPLKPGRTEPGVSVGARIERAQIEELQRITGRSKSDLIELGLRLVHAHLTGNESDFARLIASLPRRSR